MKTLEKSFHMSPARIRSSSVTSTHGWSKITKLGKMSLSDLELGVATAMVFCF